jgi:hypothetical protein
MAAEPTQLVEGVVDAANETGVQLGGVWYNRSRFKPVALPARGERVRLEVKDGFIRAVLAAQGALPEQANLGGAPLTEQERVRGQIGSLQRPAIDSRDQQIRRLALVKAAAGYPNWSAVVAAALGPS